MKRTTQCIAGAIVLMIVTVSCGTMAVARPPPALPSEPARSMVLEEVIAPYAARFGRQRPLIAVVGENTDGKSSTELTDFVVPYGILARAQVADVISVATNAGAMQMRPALRIDPQTTVAQFDVDFPDGADYVVVPAVTRSNAPVLIDWLKRQSVKGATLVSICDGAIVLANSGLLKGRRATAHWDTRDLRATRYADTHWQPNSRYVADGRFVSSAGISAAIPVSLALIEAIAGRAKALAVAAAVGAPQWTSAHDSEVFQPRFGRNLMIFARTNYTNAWFHRVQRIGVPMEAGVDEVALALTIDAWSRTGRSHAQAVPASAERVVSRNGLVLMADPVKPEPIRFDRTLPPFDDMLSVRALDTALAQIAECFGRPTAYGVALDLEYPGFRR